MRIVILLVAALAIFQHRDTISRWFAPAPALREGEIVLYATDWCGYCAKTRELFAQDGVRYREVNIEKDPIGHQQYKALGGRGVPLIDVRGQILHGYSPAHIRAAY